MANMIGSGLDVVAFLEEQHDQIEMAFEQVEESSGEERRNLFVALRRLLAVHETAEEEIVHPAARRSLANGEVIVDARLQEENEAKKILMQLEDLDVGSAEFERQFALLKSSVLLHARAEEQNEFADLAALLDTEQLQKMQKAVSFAESIAPTRPHPGVESRVANMLAGPFAAMVDRARDAISGKS
jgi:hypothetical protein